MKIIQKGNGIDKIERDYSMTSEKQKRAIIKEYKAQGQEVLYIFSVDNRYIKAIYKEVK